VKITDMDEYNSNKNKDYVPHPVKRLFRISDKTFVVLDDKIVRQLGITEEDNAWAEQIATDEGIVLKIRKNIGEVS
jgi:hypothetical protein